jgi:hypothetical protein
LRLALEALAQDRAWLESDAPKEVWDKNNDAITACEQALEQPEPEPVANYCRECLTYNGHHEGCSHHTSPPKREPLTDEQLDDLLLVNMPIKDHRHFARAIEAAHNIGEKK